MYKFKLILLISVSFLFQQYCNAQNKIKGSVKGSLIDTVYHESMANATLSIFSDGDSTVTGHSLADSKGAFQINNLGGGNYRLLISFQGYETIQKKLSISATHPEKDVGLVYMIKASDVLAEVVIQRPPITVNGDTVAFSAGAFKTVPNANAEDLLKKLPGVEVDMDGNVTAQGEAIQKIYVDGKEFFGTDPKMATKNIPADMIESVQVYDDMSDQAKFTKIDDGSRSKTINIKLKKNTRQGYFGRGTLGYGSDDLYTGKMMVNRFYNDRRITVLGSSNNLNQQGFTSRDIVSGMGGYGGSGSLGNGINTSSSTGINYTDVIGKMQVQGSYLFSDTKKRTSESSHRKTLFPSDSINNTRDSSTFANDQRNSYDANQNHNFSLRLEYKIDSMNSILYTPNLTLQNSNNIVNDSNYTNISLTDIEYPGLSGIRRNTNQRKGVSLNNELLYRRRFFTPGRTLTVGFRNSVNNSDGSGKIFSPITFYNPDGTVNNVREKDFLSSQNTKSSNYVLSTSYTEPIGKNSILELNYAYTNNFSTSDRTAFSYRNTTKQYDSLNPQQTNYFKNKFLAHRAGLNFRYHKDGYYFQAGGSMQASHLDNNSIRGIYTAAGKDTIIKTKQSYINFFPTANFRYEFSKRKNIRLYYSGRTNQPNVRQLQDVRDETNSLRTSVGNPGLKQEFNNFLNISYKSYSDITFRYINMNVNYNQVSNKIVNSIDFDTARGKGVQLIKPVNLNGTYNASYNLSIGIPLQKGVKGNSINMGNRMGFGRDVSQLYGKNNFTNTFSVSQSLGLNLNVQEKLNMEFRGRLSYNSVTYSVKQNANNNLNSKYFSQNYSTNINYYILKDLIASTDFNYSIRSGLADGYNLSIPLWNGGIAWQMFPKKNGQLKFSVNDLLNQNSDIDRKIGENYISDSRTAILQRYYLLTFTYNFKQFGTKGAFNRSRREGDNNDRFGRREGMPRGGGRGGMRNY
ncbi:MAG: outer membrane beta-barrel protein [Ginsengibacter sp.]